MTSWPGAAAAAKHTPHLATGEGEDPGAGAALAPRARPQAASLAASAVGSEAEGGSRGRAAALATTPGTGTDTVLGFEDALGTTPGTDTVLAFEDALATTPGSDTFLAFEDALALVHGLALDGRRGWHLWQKSGDRPGGVPANPSVVYQHRGWRGWAHWLGAPTAATGPRGRDTNGEPHPGPPLSAPPGAGTGGDSTVTARGDLGAVRQVPAGVPPRAGIVAAATTTGAAAAGVDAARSRARHIHLDAMGVRQFAIHPRAQARGPPGGNRALILFGWVFFLISPGSLHVRCTPIGRK